VKNTRKYYSDPGHGWIAVKYQEIIDLGIADKITSFSYKKGKTIYLEEDQDASTYIKAYKEHYGEEVNFIRKNTNKNSPIRNYEPFSLPF
jgi:hypothetical protein